MPSHSHLLKHRFIMWDAGAPYEIMNGDNTWKGNLQYTYNGDAKWYATHPVGDSKSHNNLQPYLCVYIFKRTA